VAGGIIPLSPYFFIGTASIGLYYSCVIELIGLFVFGYFKSKVTGQPVWTGALKVTITGVLAAGAAFGIARLISAH